MIIALCQTCHNTRVIYRRGCCRCCHRKHSSAVRGGHTTWAALEAAGKIAPVRPLEGFGTAIPTRGRKQP